jgi:AcrR family transcriptional regulator
VVNVEENDRESVRVGLRERQRAQRDEAILNSVLHLLAQKHYEAMTMDDVADQAGISKPTLYQYYHSKEAVTIRAMIGLLDLTTHEIRSVSPDIPAFQRIERLVQSAMSKRRGSRWRAFLNAKSALLPIVQRDPEFRAAAQRYHEAVTEVIETARAAGEIDAELSNDVLLLVISRLFAGDEFDALVTGKTTPSDVSSLIGRIFLQGIRPAERRDGR